MPNMKISKWLLQLLGSYLLKEFPPKHGYLCDFGRICHEVRLADVLLIEGRNRISTMIQKVTLSPWSHAALYIGRIHDIDDALLREKLHQHYGGPSHDQLLIESLPTKGTILSPLSKYKADHIRICRPSGLTYQDAQKVIAETIKHIGRQYNTRQFFDLGRFLLASHFIPSHWKSTLFSPEEPSQAIQDICSTMIAAAFHSIRFPVLPLIKKSEKNKYELIHRNPKLFAPNDFDYSPYFNIIKYPIFPVSDVAPYKDLPWNEGAIYSDGMGVSEVHIKK
jgi:hypothetical protein